MITELENFPRIRRSYFAGRGDARPPQTVRRCICPFFGRKTCRREITRYSLAHIPETIALSFPFSAIYLFERTRALISRVNDSNFCVYQFQLTRVTFAPFVSKFSFFFFSISHLSCTRSNYRETGLNLETK